MFPSEFMTVHRVKKLRKADTCKLSRESKNFNQNLDVSISQFDDHHCFDTEGVPHHQKLLILPFIGFSIGVFIS